MALTTEEPSDDVDWKMQAYDHLRRNLEEVYAITLSAAVGLLGSVGLDCCVEMLLPSYVGLITTSTAGSPLSL